MYMQARKEKDIGQISDMVELVNEILLLFLLNQSK